MSSSFLIGVNTGFAVIAAVDPGFPRFGDPTYYSTKVSQKLAENKEKWAERGASLPPKSTNELDFKRFRVKLKC